MNEVKDNPENVKMTKKKGITEFYYEHVDKNIKWVTKAIRKNNDFYLLTINCELKKWENEKSFFLGALNSFRLI